MKSATSVILICMLILSVSQTDSKTTGPQRPACCQFGCFLGLCNLPDITAEQGVAKDPSQASSSAKDITTTILPPALPKTDRDNSRHLTDLASRSDGSGCILSNEDVKECGEPCIGDLHHLGHGEVCDGYGDCVSVEFNPCTEQGCWGKLCGEECLVGDIQGTCDSEGECRFTFDKEECPKAGTTQDTTTEYTTGYFTIEDTTTEYTTTEYTQNEDEDYNPNYRNYES